jgi:prefoldin beta subunit
MATIEAALKVQEHLQAATAEYQRLQNELSTAVEARQRLDAQLSENELVKKVCLFFVYILNTKALRL